VASFY